MTPFSMLMDSGKIFEFNARGRVVDLEALFAAFKDAAGIIEGTGDGVGEKNGETMSL